MKLEQELHKGITESLIPLFGNQFQIQEYQPVSGGCINNGGYLRTNCGAFFLKYNQRTYEGMFEAEAQGLKRLQAADALHVPTVYGTGECNSGHSFLVTEWIGTGKPVPDFWERLGHGLASLHKETDDAFGLDFDNYIGKLPQYNQQADKWSEFFINQRMEPQIQLGLSNGLLNDYLTRSIRALYPYLDQWFPAEPPSLLHGDLWSGNLLVDDEGEPAIIDPAVYYGHREMELAFTMLFGGFNERFYRSYNEVWPLARHFEERQDLYNIYPLLVHVNLFGGGFVHQLEATIKKLLASR